MYFEASSNLNRYWLICSDNILIDKYFMNFFHLISTNENYLLFFSTDKRGIDSRLASAQTALMLQEETIRRNERERKVMTDKINSLERSLAAADTEKRQQEVS